MVKQLGIGRQTISKHLRDLINKGVLEKSGTTRAARYFLKTGPSAPLSNRLEFIKKNANLQEHEVYEEVERRLSLKKRLNKNSNSIVLYAFSEMLNNAIDHSNSEKIKIVVELINNTISFQVKDYGIGIFKNIQDGFALENEFEAVNHLITGKKTTMPSRHSGEGIFFTSKIADTFKIRSHSLTLKFLNLAKDVALEESKKVRGTEVDFKIKIHTKKKLENLFREYSDDDYQFDKSVAYVKLGQYNTLISRSQARKITAGLDDFKRIVFDMRGLKEIGQAFCDEVFRVYQVRNPDKLIKYENASDTIEFMIQRIRFPTG